MDIVNRSVVILRPKEPYLAWAKLDDDSGLAEPVFDDMRQHPTTHLVPGWEDDEGEKEVKEVLAEFWPKLFEEMLEAWLRDESGWPKGRTVEMFREWFEVETHSMVVDQYDDEPLGYLD